MYKIVRNWPDYWCLLLNMEISFLVLLFFFFQNQNVVRFSRFFRVFCRGQMPVQAKPLFELNWHSRWCARNLCHLNQAWHEIDAGYLKNTWWCRLWQYVHDYWQLLSPKPTIPILFCYIYFVPHSHAPFCLGGVSAEHRVSATLSFAYSFVDVL